MVAAGCPGSLPEDSWDGDVATACPGGPYLHLDPTGRLLLAGFQKKINVGEQGFPIKIVR